MVAWKKQILHRLLSIYYLLFKIYDSDDTIIYYRNPG